MYSVSQKVAPPQLFASFSLRLHILLLWIFCQFVDQLYLHTFDNIGGFILIFSKTVLFCTLLHWMQGGLLAKNVSIRLSVSPSVKRVNCDKMKESCARILIPYEWPFILVLWQEEWLVGATPVTEILRQTDRVRVKSPILSRYSLVAPQP